MHRPPKWVISIKNNYGTIWTSLMPIASSQLWAWGPGIVNLCRQIHTSMLLSLPVWNRITSSGLPGRSFIFHCPWHWKKIVAYVWISSHAAPRQHQLWDAGMITAGMSFFVWQQSTGLWGTVLMATGCYTSQRWRNASRFSDPQLSGRWC